jgi:hypothetical protein
MKGIALNNMNESDSIAGSCGSVSQEIGNGPASAYPLGDF